MFYTSQVQPRGQVPHPMGPRSALGLRAPRRQVLNSRGDKVILIVNLYVEDVLKKVFIFRNCCLYKLY